MNWDGRVAGGGRMHPCDIEYIRNFLRMLAQGIVESGPPRDPNDWEWIPGRPVSVL